MAEAARLADILAYVGETVSEYYFVGQGLTEWWLGARFVTHRLSGIEFFGVMWYNGVNNK